MRVGRSGEYRIFEQVFPGAGKFAARQYMCGLRGGEIASAHHIHLAAWMQLGRGSDRNRRNVQLLQRQHQAESGYLIVGQRVRGHFPTLGGGQPHVGRLGHQIADRQNQSAGFDDHTVAGAMTSENTGGKCVFGDDRAQLDH
jgi:hypothetical protein